MANRYWVGNGGTWDSSGTTHWSSSSGGSGGASVPIESDNVIFDSHSFTSTGQTVTITTVYPCKSFTCATVSNDPTFLMSTTLSILSNSFSLSVNATFTDGGVWLGGFSFSLSSDMTLTIPNSSLDISLQFNLNGYTLDLASDINLTGLSAFTFFEGVLNANNYNITVSNFVFWGGGTTFNMGTGTWTCTNDISIVKTGGLFPVMNSSLATLKFINSYYGDNYYLSSASEVASTLEFANIIINGSGTATPYVLDISYIGNISCTNFIIQNPSTSIKFKYGKTYTFTNFTCNGTPTNLNNLYSSLPGSQSTLSSSNVSVSYTTVRDNIAAGDGIPFIDNIGGVDSGNNINWIFDIGVLYQKDISIESGQTYKLTFVASEFTSNSDPGTISIKQGTQTLDTFTTEENGSKTIIFTADDSGLILGFYPNILVASGKIDNVGLRKRLSASTNDNVPIKEFLTGNTDEGGVIFFRADTQTLQVQPSPQMYSNPIAVVTELERGTQMKSFISLNDRPFLQLEGTITKGVSILKPATSSNIDSLDPSKPPLTQSIQLSFRDSSKNLCRITQAAVILNPSSIDYAQ